MEQGGQHLGHQRSCQGKCCCGSGKEREERQKVDELSWNAVHLVSKERAACLRVFLLVAAPYMKHKAEAHGEHQVERPRDRTPVEERVGAGPGLHRAHLGDMRVVGVEDYETKPGMSRLYNYVNFDLFQNLPVTGTNGEPFVEEIINVDPQVIVMSSYASQDPDELSQKTGIPVVVVPGSDTTLDEKAYVTIRILGELYQLEDRAEDLTAYLKSIQKDLDDRTASIAEDAKPTCYVGGVSFKGHHGFEGTEAYYGPFELIHAKNLANTTGQTGAFNIDVEQVLSWDPEIIFLDFNGMNLINEDYGAHPDFYNALTAVQEGKVYSQISFRSSASNLETALADAYYAACVMYPQQFQDIDPVEKAGEIFTKLLGSNPYHDLEEAGYAFCQITIGA